MGSTVSAPAGAQPDVSARHQAVRVLVVEFLPAGGLYQFSLQLAEGIAAAGGDDVDVVLLTGPDPEPPPSRPDVTVRSDLPTWRPGRDPATSRWRHGARRAVRALRYVAAWRRVADVVRELRPDVVLFSDWHFALDAVMLRRVVPDLRAPDRPLLAAVAHTPVPWHRGARGDALHRDSPLSGRAFADAYRRTDIVFVLGPTTRDQLLTAYPDVQEVAVIPHGDESHFVRNATGVDGDPAASAESTAPVALFFGNLDRYKGVERLVALWPEVRRRVPDARCRVRGAAGDGVDVDALGRAAAAAGVDLEVGWVPEGEVAALVTEARCLVAPYRAANQSGVVHLAQTFARPVVVSDVGDLADAVVAGDLADAVIAGDLADAVVAGDLADAVVAGDLADAVDHGATGFVVAPDDDDALVDALVALLSDALLAGRMGRAAAARVTAWPDVGSAVLAALRATPAFATRRCP